MNHAGAKLEKAPPSTAVAPLQREVFDVCESKSEHRQSPCGEAQGGVSARD